MRLVQDIFPVYSFSFVKKASSEVRSNRPPQQTADVTPEAVVPLRPILLLPPVPVLHADHLLQKSSGTLSSLVVSFLPRIRCLPLWVFLEEKDHIIFWGRADFPSGDHDILAP